MLMEELATEFIKNELIPSQNLSPNYFLPKPGVESVNPSQRLNSESISILLSKLRTANKKCLIYQQTILTEI